MKRKFFPLVVLLCSHVWGIHFSPKAKYVLVMNADSGKVIYQKNADEQIFPASTTKVATLLFLFEGNKLDLEQHLQIDKESIQVVSSQKREEHYDSFPAYILENDSRRVHLQENSKLNLQTAIELMMITSANDAANVIASNIGPTIPVFMERMNQYFQEMGFNSTHFKNPHGIHHPEHFTTAREMAKIFQKAVKSPLCLPWMNKKETSFEDKTYHQSNLLLREDKSLYYPYIYASKTGYTKKAGHCLLIAAKIHERPILISLFYASESRERFLDVLEIFETLAAEEKTSHLLFNAKEATFKMQKNRFTKPILARLEQDVVYSYYPSEEESLQTCIHWDVSRSVIKKGEKIGHLLIYDEEMREIGSYPLFSITDARIAPSFFYVLFWVLMSLLVVGLCLLFFSWKKRRSQSSVDNS